jgi:hypothetical protein
MALLGKCFPPRILLSQQSTYWSKTGPIILAKILKLKFIWYAQSPDHFCRNVSPICYPLLMSIMIINIFTILDNYIFLSMHRDPSTHPRRSCITHLIILQIFLCYSWDLNLRNLDTRIMWNTHSTISIQYFFNIWISYDILWFGFIKKSQFEDQNLCAI